MIRLKNPLQSDINRRSTWTLNSSQLHLWRIDLSNQVQLHRAHYDWLSPEESEKSERLLTEKLKYRFLVSRIAMREILSQYVGLSPQKIIFKQAEFGKPSLQLETATVTDIKFNLSHSANLAVLAITAKNDIGVDIELLRDVRGLSHMIDRCLSPQEQKEVLRFSESYRSREFLRFWTHKEAYLKTFGIGLKQPLEKITIDLSSPPTRRVVNAFEVFPDKPNTYISELWPGDQFVGAVSMANVREPQIETFSWVTSRNQM